MKTPYHLECEHYEEVVIAGRFRPQGTGAPIIDEGAGSFTVAWTSTGLFTVTLTETYSGYVALGAPGLQLAAATTRTLQYGTITPASRTFQIRNVDAANTVQDIAADPANSISFIVLARKGKKSPM